MLQTNYLAARVIKKVHMSIGFTHQRKHKNPGEILGGAGLGLELGIGLRLGSVLLSIVQIL